MKVRYKSKAVKLVDSIPTAGITVDGYLMISRDGGNPYDTVFDDSDREVEYFASELFDKEEVE